MNHQKQILTKAETILIDKEQTGIIDKVFTKKNFIHFAQILKASIANALEEPIIIKRAKLEVELGTIKFNRDDFSLIEFYLKDGRETICCIKYEINTNSYLTHSFDLDSYESFYTAKIKESEVWKFHYPGSSDVEMVLRDLLSAVCLYWFKLAFKIN